MKSLPAYLVLENDNNTVKEVGIIPPPVWHNIGRYLKFSDIELDWASKVAGQGIDTIRAKGVL